MPFGPLVTLILLIYLLFLGIVLTLWFVLSPGRKGEREIGRREAMRDETESERGARGARKRTPAEQRRAPGVYARNDEVRGANARGADTRGAKTSTDSAGADASTKTPAKRAPAKKNDAFEDFIRSKNDDFEF